jgi:hypothetical protein
MSYHSSFPDVHLPLVSLADYTLPDPTSGSFPRKCPNCRTTVG